MDKTYIGYARVSTIEQNETRQLESFANYSEKIRKVFIDKVSGKNMNRPQLQAMLDYVREGDVVVVSDFSRLPISSDGDSGAALTSSSVMRFHAPLVSV